MKTVFALKLMATVMIAGLAAGASAQDVPIRIGVVTPLSGTYSALGQQVKWGLELATKEVNAAGGIMGRKVELLFEDEEANPSVAAPKAEKLFQVSKVDFLTGAGRSKAESRAVLEQAYERFPRLKERRPQLGTSLSGGEQQMLAMARVLVGAPKLLLIDEPTEGLAPIIVDEIFAIIDRLRDDGIPILLVEQNVQRALDVADRFYALERGQVILSGDAASGSARSQLQEAIAV